MIYLCRFAVWTFFAAFLFLGDIQASSLRGEVVDVKDGQNITVNVEKRLVCVRLCGIKTPLGTEPLADVARDHLAVLSKGKFATINYVGLGPDGGMIAW